MKNSRVLIIDRDPSVQRVVEASLAPQGCEVTTVGDGLSGLDIALAASPDMILTDYRMAGINVFRFLEKLKQKNALKNVVLLLLINPGDTYDELTLRLAGISDFLAKPLKTEDMLDRVQRFLSTPEPAVLDQPEQTFASTETDTVKIEHLLGWSPSSTESPFSELGNEYSGSFDLSSPGPAVPSTVANDALLFTHQGEETPAETLSPDLAFGEDHIDLNDSAVPVEFPEHEADLSDEPRASAPIPASGSAADFSSNGTPSSVPELVDRTAKDVIEKIAWDVVPGLAQRSIEQVVKAVVERIVWETVPAIAETAIKNEIERLKSEDPPQQPFSG